MANKIICGIKLAVAIALAIVIQTLETRAAWGDLDTAFGSGGIAYDTVTGHRPRSVAIQQDGKILVTGYRVVSHSGERFFLAACPHLRYCRLSRWLDPVFA